MIYPEKLSKAVQFASHKHGNQKRRVYEYPYITHPLMVMHLVSHFSLDVDTLCAAVLHDTVEDTETELQEIQDEFGVTVSGLVGLLTKDDSLEYHERSEAYYRRLAESKNKEAILIKSADILYNLTDLREVVNYAGIDKTESMFKQGLVTYVNQLESGMKKLKSVWPENPFISDIQDLLASWK